VPTELADEYRVAVEMKAGPFEIDEKAESVLKAADLRSPKP
jgi:hypothetical protein